MTSGTPAPDREIHDRLVYELLRDQHPDLADAALQRIDIGWDNVVYRLGERFAVRLPRRKEAVALIEHEQTWLPRLAPRLPLPISSPVRVGVPSRDYPWPWSILPWLPGKTADLEPSAADQAQPLADFLRALHQLAPPDAPKNDHRGVPLGKRANAVNERLDRLRGFPGVISPGLNLVWNEALAAAESDESRWLHGDLHARNVLVEAGVITGIIDWGDITSGDVATDLACVWMLFDEPNARADCLQQYQASTPVRARAMGWAVLFGAVLLETGLIDHPRHAAMGEAILRRLSEDA